MISVVPGCVIAIKCWWGEHWGIVGADQYGRATIVSNRGLRGRVTEELWEEVVGAAEWRIVDNFASTLHTYFVIERARSKIGTQYNFFTWNCQDLVYWALGFQPQSPQRDAATALTSFACLVVLLGVAGKRG